MSATVASELVRVPADGIDLDAALWLPQDCPGIVVFAYAGSGSRIRPPNDYVASVLRGARLGTLWIDLLQDDEARSYQMRSDVGLLADRLHAACDWVRHGSRTRDLALGVFGIRYSAVAAMQVAAMRASGINAIVARSCHAEVAERHLVSRINVPTLLIVGELDDPRVRSNRVAYAALRCKKRIEIVPGATNGFEEPGNQEVVARLARSWFLQHTHSSALY